MRETDNSKQINIINSFINEIISITGLKQILQINISDFKIFQLSEDFIETVTGHDWKNIIKEDKKYDLIAGNFPLGMRPGQKYTFNTHELTLRKNWIEIIEAISLLNEKGLGIFIVEPNGFSSIEGEKFKNALYTEGYFINGIFNLPEDTFKPITSINPILIIINKERTEKTLIAELQNELQAKELAKNYILKKQMNDLTHGMYIPEKFFRGFQQLKMQQQLDKLEAQYKQYKKYTIGEITTGINYVKSGEQFTEKENSIYIPKVGNSPVISKIEDTKIKHQNYFQLTLNELVINDYLAAFFRTELGKIILQTIMSGTVIQQINKRDIEQLIIAIPTIEVQKQIIETHQKMNQLKLAIENFDGELAVNPSSASQIREQLDSMLEAIGGLTDADQIRNIIRQGESINIEFKQTMSLDVKKGTKEKYIELAILKTIIAFLNTEGGILLVGVNDTGEITGVDIEIDKFHKSTDKFLLFFTNLIRDRIGKEFYDYIKHRLIKIENMYILKVECRESKTPCYLDNTEFYIRTNPATDKLEGPKLVAYIKSHFKD